MQQYSGMHVTLVTSAGQYDMHNMISGSNFCANQVVHPYKSLASPQIENHLCMHTWHVVMTPYNYSCTLKIPRCMCTSQITCSQMMIMVKPQLIFKLTWCFSLLYQQTYSDSGRLLTYKFIIQLYPSFHLLKQPTVNKMPDQPTGYDQDKL